MITNLDRSGWIGASDTKFVVAKNHNTATWVEWWSVKLGLAKQKPLSTRAIRAGNAWEHKILDAIDPTIRKDYQICRPEYRLRVNYDGDKDNLIHEVKTYSLFNGPEFLNDKGELKRRHAYWYQAQAEMFAMGTDKLEIDAYGLAYDEYDEDYEGEVDMERLLTIPVKYDEQWIEKVYLPCLTEAAQALKERRFPNEIPILS